MTLILRWREYRTYLSPAGRKRALHISISSVSTNAGRKQKGNAEVPRLQANCIAGQICLSSFTAPASLLVASYSEQVILAPHQPMKIWATLPTANNPSYTVHYVLILLSLLFNFVNMLRMVRVCDEWSVSHGQPNHTSTVKSRL